MMRRTGLQLVQQELKIHLIMKETGRRADIKCKSLDKRLERFTKTLQKSGIKLFKTKSQTKKLGPYS